jgi:hypothetical protein
MRNNPNRIMSNYGIHYTPHPNRPLKGAIQEKLKIENQNQRTVPNTWADIKTKQERINRLKTAHDKKYE